MSKITVIGLNKPRALGLHIACNLGLARHVRRAYHAGVIAVASGVNRLLPHVLPRHNDGDALRTVTFVLIYRAM